MIILLLIAVAGTLAAVQHFFANPATVWRGCGGEFQCASVAVPLDYSTGSSGSIDVAVIRKPATDRAHRIGSLLLAGPAAGVDFLRHNSIFYSAVNGRFDLVAFDERGFGRSSPVRCLTDAQDEALDDVDTVLDDPSEKQVFIQATQALAQACELKAGRILPFVDSESAARDVDAIRVALGEAKITVFAYGYAALLGQEYAHLYPTHLRALALDAVVDPEASPVDEWRMRAAGFQAELDAFLADCHANAACALAQAGDPGTRLNQLMQTIDQAPLRVGARVLGRRLALSAMVVGLDPRAWPQLDIALDSATRGDGAALLALADMSDGRLPDGKYLVSPEAFTAQRCVDRSVPTDIRDYDVLGDSMSKASPIFGPAFQYVAFSCASWPAKPRSTPGSSNAPGAPPALLVAGTHDPYYPFTAGQAVNARLPGSVLLTRDGFGVLSYPNSGCVRLAVNAYLTSLTLPASGTVCSSDYPA